jgi:co-chaperonin GroES (HSP10)
MDVHLIPVGERILVELDDITNRKVGMIEIPDTEKELLRSAKVIATGDTNGLFSVGDRILFHAYSGVNVHCPSLGVVNDNEFRFLMTSEVLAKVGD